MPKKLNRKKLTKAGRDAAEEILAEFLAKGNRISDEPRFPVSSDFEVATLYASPSPNGPNAFKVPGVDSISSRVQLYINEATAFTGAYSCMDPETGITRKSKNGHADCVKDWLNIYLMSYKHIVEQYKSLDSKEEKQSFLDEHRPELVTLALHLDQLASNPNLNKTQKQKISRAQNGITKMMTIYANAELARSIALNQEKAIDQAYEYYLEAKNNRTLSSRELKTLEDTLLDLTSRSSNYSWKRTEILSEQQQRSINEQEAVGSAARTITSLIDNTAGYDYKKKQELIDFTSKQLKAPGKQVSVQVKSWNTDYSNLLSEILDVKSKFSLADQREISRRVERNYSMENTIIKPTSSFTGQLSSGKVQTYFPEFYRATKEISNVAFRPVCGGIDAEQVKRFATTYANYHELMMSVMIFYYTACSAAYDDADITNLAQDWLNWLQGNPFLMKLPADGNVRKMRAEEFLPFAPQNIFTKVLIPTPDWNSIGNTGLTQGNFGLTQDKYISEYENMLELAHIIQGSCTDLVSNGGKIDSYSERYKFLSQVVLNFNAVWKAIQENKGGIEWKIVDGKVKRIVDRSVISSCVSNLQGIADQLNNVTSTPATASSTPRAPVVAPPPPSVIP